MEIKRHYKRTETGALIMNSDNIVTDYLNKKKLLTEIGRIQKFSSTIKDALEFMELLRFSEEFISLVNKQQLLVMGETGVELSPKMQEKGTGILPNDAPVVLGISVTRLPNSGKQNFTQKVIDRLAQEGFLSLVKGKLILHTVGIDIEFDILRTPGYYCCHTNLKLDGEKEARAYIKANFAGKTSPCKNNPAGYRKDNFYACQLIATTTEGEG